MLFAKLLLVGVLVMLVAVVCAETSLRVIYIDLSLYASNVNGIVVLRCLNNTITVRNPTWLRNGLNLHMTPGFNTSRILIDGRSATATFLPPVFPEYEGRYQCKVGSVTSPELLFKGIATGSGSN